MLQKRSKKGSNWTSKSIAKKQTERKKNVVHEIIDIVNNRVKHSWRFQGLFFPDPL